MYNYNADKISHTVFEDILAIIIGSIIISFAIVLLNQSGTLVGGAVGLAILLHNVSGIKFGIIFFIINMGFYYLAFRKMGVSFVIKTFISVALVSMFADLQTQFIVIGEIEPFYAAILAGIMMGVGLVILFRHKSSLGGLNILALYLQDKHGIRAGNVQMAIDLVILLASTFLVAFPLVLASIVCALILNLIIALNHRPNRYIA